MRMPSRISLRVSSRAAALPGAASILELPVSDLRALALLKGTLCYEPQPARTMEDFDADRDCRARPDGRGDRGAADRGRPHAHGMEPLAREGQAARNRRCRARPFARR